MRVLKNILTEINDSGNLATVSPDVAANMIYALLVEATLTIAASDDKKKAHDEALKILHRMLIGLKS